MNIYGIKDSANLTIKHKSGENKGKVFLYADYATVSTNEWTSEQVYAKSKSVNAIRWDFGRASTLKVDMEIFDLKWIAMLFGSDFVKGATNILRREILTVGEEHTATMNGSPVTGSMSVYTLDDDGLTNLEELTLSSDSVETGKYTISGNEITVHTDITAGSQLAVFYLEAKAESRTLTINADLYPENFEIYGDTEIKGTDDSIQFVQIHYLNVKPKSTFTLTLDASNVATVSAEFDVLKDSGSGDMATYTVYK